MNAADWRPPTLTTARLSLRALAESDTDAIFAYASNQNMTRYTLWETHKSRADSVDFVHRYAQSSYRAAVPEPLAITLSETGELVGTAGCFWASRGDRAMELGYAVAEPHWGRGIAGEASAALLDHVFGRYAVRRVQARAIAENLASRRVLEKLGFRFEGVLRSSLLRRGRYWDVYHYSILDEEWPAASGRVNS